MPGAEVVATSAKTGQGLDELRAALGEAADRVAAERAEGPTRLFVDRVFTLRGIGTVGDRNALVGVGRRGRPPAR